MNSSFWEGKRVLITGHTGFKGSWLSLWLQFLGADVLGYALESPTEPSLFKLAAIADGMTSLTGDIRDEHRLRQIIVQYQPEIVFHMAAQALVLESYKNPVATYETNVMGTVHLLDSVRRAGGIRAVVIVTSDKCYENREWFWPYREYESLGGHDPYSSSKGCAEIVTAAYRRSFFSFDYRSDHITGVASARAGNVIGGGDWSKDRLVPDTLRSLMNGQSPVIRKESAIRPWQHVLEPLNGYLTLAEHLYRDAPGFSEAWNFGPEKSGVKPVSWVANQLISLWGHHNDSWVPDQTRRPHEDNYLTLDCSKAHVRLGWKPVIDLRTALRWTVEWAKSFLAKADMRNVTEGQIVKFMATANKRGVDGTTIEQKEAQDTSDEKVIPLQEHFFDLVNDSVMTRTIEGRIKFWNRQAEELYGWRREEAIGKVSHDLLQTQFPKPLEEIKSELVQKGRWEGKLVHSTRDGGRIAVESRWALDRREKSGAVVEISRRSDDCSSWADAKLIGQKILNFLLVVMADSSSEVASVVPVC